MKKSAMLVRMLSVVWAASLFTCGCVDYTTPPVATVGTEVDVVGAPPAPIVEEAAPCPGVGFVWIGGAWAWHGRWEWEKGRWERPPRPGAVWVPHRYVDHNGRHAFIRGGWRGP